MSFLISKALGFLLLPSNVVTLTAILGVVLSLAGWRRTGWGLTALSIMALALVGWSPIGRWAIATLEDRFPPPQLDGPVSGIVMLGGAVNVHISEDRNTPTLSDAAERVTAVAELARRYPDARILLSGGASDLHHGGAATESSIAKNLLVAMGVPEERMTLEEQSRDTCENAGQSASLARPKSGETWLLVTSASHMPRSVACFRAAGFPVLPYPVDYRTRDVRTSSVVEGLAMADLAAHEWIGLIGYRAAGRTRDLLPAP